MIDVGNIPEGESFITLTRLNSGGWKPSINGVRVIGVSELHVDCGGDESTVVLVLDPRYVRFETEVPDLKTLDS